MAGNAQGLAEAYRLLDLIPTAVEQELATEMALIGRELLAAQQADVARDTGALAADLSLQVILERLKVRVGLLRGAREAYTFNGRLRRAVQGGPFYGRFVEFGRRAQTVLVTRRIKRANRRLTGNNRKGQTRSTFFRGSSDRLRRRGPNRGTPIGSPYKMRVKAQAARPFVAQPILSEVADAHLSEFWAHALERLGNSR